MQKRKKKKKKEKMEIVLILWGQAFVQVCVLLSKWTTWACVDKNKGTVEAGSYRVRLCKLQTVAPGFKTVAIVRYFLKLEVNPMLVLTTDFQF